jgi:hypothetical protein
VKWLALLGAIVILGAAALFIRGRAPPPPSPSPTATQPPASPAASVPASMPPRPTVASSAGPWQRIELRGVLFRQDDPAASQALLSLDGQRAQVFHGGEPVLQGWMLQSIRQDHVVVAKGAEQHRLDVVQSALAPPVAAPAASASAPREVPLPGFIPGPPRQVAPPPPSLETNRRFLQDRLNRAAGIAQ